MLGALFDGIPVPPASMSRDREPRAVELLKQAGGGLAEMPAAVLGAGRALLGLADTAWSSWRAGTAGPPLPFSAPPTIINRPLSGRLSWAPAVIDLDRLRAIKAAADATINDVVLAICAGALRAWLLERDQLPDAPLVAMVPVSVRADGERGEAGNLVSAMLVSLATDEPDPRRRLRAIRDSMRASKAAHAAVGARSLLASTTLLPFALLGTAVRFYSGFHLAAHHPPAFNLVITNIPGPSQPLRVGGAVLLNHIPAAPLFDGLGVILSVFSYAGRLSLGVTADHAVLPDAMVLARHLLAAVEAFEQASGCRLE
jgi:WS/DGAT/MGAT family acyltransferase